MKKAIFVLLSGLVIAGYIFARNDKDYFIDSVRSLDKRTDATIQTDTIPAPEPLLYELNRELASNDCTGDSLPAIDNSILQYMKMYDMVGLSLAVTQNDSLVYAKGYGWAEKEKQIKMGPGHVLRLASVSKLITATAVMRLCEQGILSLDSHIFGKDGLLADEPYAREIKDSRCSEITVEHLLRHQAGFYPDPVFWNNSTRIKMHLDHTPTYEDYARLMLKSPLSFQPGTSQFYSNFGFMMLAAVIEKVTGRPYEEYVREKVLAPAGCYDMHFAGNYYSDKRENEVRYYCHDGKDRYTAEFNGSGKRVEKVYGGNNIPLLSGAGAWCASSIEIARFVATIDGHPEIPDIISEESLEAMTEYFNKDIFSLGWNDTRPDSGWTRTGTLSGTTALVKHYPDGQCWVVLSNTSTKKGHYQYKCTDQLIKDIRKTYPDIFPARDLFNK